MKIYLIIIYKNFLNIELKMLYTTIFIFCLASRLEEKENEMKKEYAKLHERYTEVSILVLYDFMCKFRFDSTSSYPLFFPFTR